MLGNITQHPRKGTDAEIRVARDRDVVLAVFDGGEPKVAAGLTG